MADYAIDIFTGQPLSVHIESTPDENGIEHTQTVVSLNGDITKVIFYNNGQIVTVFE